MAAILSSLMPADTVSVWEQNRESNRGRVQMAVSNYLVWECDNCRVDLEPDVCRFAFEDEVFVLL